MRYRALIEYDGTAYFGFQRQKAEQPTIQGELEAAISHLARTPVAVAGSGRTDSGVHAHGQVISFDIAWSHGAPVLQRALNATLPADISVLALDEVAPDFHARYSAIRRSYEYHIYNAPIRSSLRRLRSWHVSQPLSLERMTLAAQALVGVHDFATFGQPPQGDSTVRELFRAAWRKQDSLLILELEANAFLYRMVRSIVGALKRVGEGALTGDEFVAAFQAHDRSRAETTAPAHGLYLVSVKYD